MLRDYKDKKRLVKMFGLYKSNEMKEVILTIIVVITIVVWAFLF